MKEPLRRLLAHAMAALLRLGSRHYVLRPAPVLVVAPHADDETLGCGGLLAAKASAGQRVAVAFLTDSAGAGSSAALGRCRTGEACAALAALGLPPDSAHFLGAPDGRLDRLEPGEARALQDQLAELLRTVRPAEIFLPFLGGGSTEHDAAVRIGRAALAATGCTPVVWEYPVWAWWNALRLRGRLFRPGGNVRLELPPDWLARKRQALACHVSQTSPAGPEPAFVLPAVLRDRAASPTEFYFQSHS